MTESTTSSPHDAVFKTFMFTPETARDFLEIHLPEPLRKLCNLQTLRLEPTSFIEKSLRAYYSDVLWSVETSEGDGYIYCVIEHQSSAEKNMAFRLMRYATAAMQRHLDKGYDRVPLVVPLLFYHGEASPYPYSLNWLDEFDDPQLARQLYTEAFPLVDITIVPDDEIMQHRRIALLELIQKHIRDRDLIGMVDRITTLLVRDWQEGKLEGLQQGKLEGLQKGKLEGLQEGMHEQAIKIALRMLEQGIDRDQVLAATQLSEADLAANNH